MAGLVCSMPRGLGGAIAGIFIASEKNYPYTPLSASLGFAILGAIGGLIVWIWGRRSSEPQPVESTAPIRSIQESSILSHRFAWKAILAGLFGLGFNHASVIFAQKKWLMPVVGGSFLIAIGLAGFIYPPLLSGKQKDVSLTWWSHVLIAAFVLLGIMIGCYLWFVVYK